MKNIIIGVIAIIGVCFIVYSFYWLAKTVSYKFFYEDMVKQTIQEMVKPEYLISE